MRALLLAALLLAAPAFAGETIQPTLLHLRIGDKLKDVQRIYAPAKDQPVWPSYVDPRGRIQRVRVERSYLRKPIRSVDTLWLGFKRNRLVEIQIVYDMDFTRANSVDSVASEWLSIYGDANRSDDGGYWWSDGNTVLRVMNARIPVGDGSAVELRTSVQLFEQGVFERVD